MLWQFPIIDKQFDAFQRSVQRLVYGDESSDTPSPPVITGSVTDETRIQQSTYEIQEDTAYNANPAPDLEEDEEDNEIDEDFYHGFQLYLKSRSTSFPFGYVTSTGYATTTPLSSSSSGNNAAPATDKHTFHNDKSIAQNQVKYNRNKRSNKDEDDEEKKDENKDADLVISDQYLIQKLY